MTPPTPAVETLVRALQQAADPAVLQTQLRFGIQPTRPLGVTMPRVRELSKGCKRDHPLALDLWETGWHEARILAGLVDDPRQTSREQMERWTSDFDSWDLCDQTCMNLYVRTPFAVEAAFGWAEREEEYIRRAGFVRMAGIAIHQKKLADEALLPFLPVIEAHARDGRNFVRKAVNWALRALGKRSRFLCEAALKSATRMEQMDHPTARWIAADAIRELEGKRINWDLDGK